MIYLDGRAVSCYNEFCFYSRPTGADKRWDDSRYSWRRYPLETFSVLLALCEGIHRWPVDSPTKASNAELWCFPLCMPEQTVKQTIETPVIWEAIALIMITLGVWYHNQGSLRTRVAAVLQYLVCGMDPFEQKLKILLFAVIKRRPPCKLHCRPFNLRLYEVSWCK